MVLFRSGCELRFYHFQYLATVSKTQSYLHPVAKTLAYQLLIGVSLRAATNKIMHLDRQQKLIEAQLEECSENHLKLESWLHQKSFGYHVNFLKSCPMLPATSCGPLCIRPKLSICISVESSRLRCWGCGKLVNRLFACLVVIFRQNVHFVTYAIRYATLLNA